MKKALIAGLCGLSLIACCAFFGNEAKSDLKVAGGSGSVLIVKI